MLNLPRILIHQIRTVFKKALGITSKSQPGPPVTFTAGPEGLDIRAATFDAAVEFHLAGSFEPDEFAIPLSVLADCEGKKDDSVTFERDGKNIIRATWSDAGLPHERQVVPSREKAIPVPPRPEVLVSNEPGLLAALRDAVGTTDRESFRFALGCVQLRGDSGRLAATDGRHLFVQAGYQFPWSGDVLMRGSGVFGCREMPEDQPVSIGRSERYVSLAIGPWTIHLAIDKEGRFPKVDDIIPAAENAVARLHLAPADANFLIGTLDRLPKDDDDEHHAITLDLDGQVIVRAKSAEQPRPTELVLSNSKCVGDPLRININRQYLARAVKLGFGEIMFFGANRPALVQDGAQGKLRSYLWMPLDSESAIPPSKDALRIESAAADVVPFPAKPNPRRKRVTMTQTTNTSIAVAESPAPNTEQLVTNSQAEQKLPVQRAARRKTARQQVSSPIEQAVTLRTSLRTALVDTNELIRSLKRQQKQHRLVRSTLASLKELQAAG